MKKSFFLKKVDNGWILTFNSLTKVYESNNSDDDESFPSVLRTITTDLQSAMNKMTQRDEAYITIVIELNPPKQG